MVGEHCFDENRVAQHVAWLHRRMTAEGVITCPPVVLWREAWHQLADSVAIPDEVWDLIAPYELRELAKLVPARGVDAFDPEPHPTRTTASRSPTGFCSTTR